MNSSLSALKGVNSPLAGASFIDSHDSQGQPDPRTIQNLEQALQAAGGRRTTEGLFIFDTGDLLH